MQQEVITNPFRIQYYDYSWNDIREMVNTMVARQPKRYRLAYHNDYYQKIILLINLHPTFDIQHANLIYISKIDAEPQSSLLIYETKKYDGDITNIRDYQRGTTCMQEFSNDLFLVNHVN
ncbi:hypothetical protein I5907_20600 [Panacibacter sp. DH6]|uniref:Uncharacterized protein n=1 Tax=Panacibacter microcysteis TaxID=2793269 RepID=A0A931H093_9BACT|nr:hypothetical protein [Panacibacter microcysteis]MBG9378644.1 hypothetical protein [Panacibacter microcysteis]